MIYQVGQDRFVASSRRTYIPGVFDSERTARYAFRFPDKDLWALQESLNPNGIITFEHLRALKAKKADA